MYYLLNILLIIFILGVFFYFYKSLKKKTVDLEERNKHLASLRKLDETMIFSSRDLATIAQEVTDAIASVLKFEIGVLALIDEQKGVLRRVAMSNTMTGIQAKQTLPFPYEKLEIPLNYEQNLAIKVLKINKLQITHDLYDVFMPVLNKDMSHKIQETVGVKTSLIYPVRVGGRPIGTMIISIGRLENQLSIYELESIEDLVGVVGTSLENAMLYEDLKKTSLQLKQVNAKLKELDLLKDDFVSIASHELRTPMTAIKSYAWMALNRPDITLTDKMKNYLEKTLISTERLINLVNDMLNVSRIEAGSIEIRPKSFDIRVLSEEVMVEVGPKALEKSLHLEVEKGNPLNIFADPDKVHQVLLNLVGNSLKFTPAEGKIDISFFPDGKMVDISVKDNGVGISPDDQSRLFKKFERLDNSYVSSATSGGTGLGLFISKSLVELMGGKIWVSSEGTGKGTTFTFSLPLSTPEVLAQAEKYTRKPAGEAKILEPVVI